MNNWYSFQIPYFNSQFGVDWGNFTALIDNNVDYVMSKTYGLYALKDISQMNSTVLEMQLKLKGIKTDSTEPTSIKKEKLRRFNKDSKSKGTADVYLDYTEMIFGMRATIYNGILLGSSIWGESIWGEVASPTSDDKTWPSYSSGFSIYMVINTMDMTDFDAKLDLLTSIYRQDFLLPAFYDIYLVDGSFNILRTV